MTLSDCAEVYLYKYYNDHNHHLCHTDDTNNLNISNLQNRFSRTFHLHKHNMKLWMYGLFYVCGWPCIWYSLQWRHNDHDGVSNHQPHDCLLNRLFRRNQRNHQSSASLAFVRGIHRGPVNSPHKGPVTQKMFPFDDVIMDVRLCEVHAFLFQFT